MKSFRGSALPDLAEMEGKLDAQREEPGDPRGELRRKADRHGLPGKEKDACEQIKGAPEEVDERGGIANASRLGKRRWKRRSLESAKKVREAIAEKGSGKEISHAG